MLQYKIVWVCGQSIAPSIRMIYEYARSLGKSRYLTCCMTLLAISEAMTCGYVF